MSSAKQYLIVWQQISGKNHKFINSGTAVIEAPDQEKAKRLYRRHHRNHEVLNVLLRTGAEDDPSPSNN